MNVCRRERLSNSSLVDQWCLGLSLPSYICIQQKTLLFRFSKQHHPEVQVLQLSIVNFTMSSRKLCLLSLFFFATVQTQLSATPISPIRAEEMLQMNRTLEGLKLHCCTLQEFPMVYKQVRI